MSSSWYGYMYYPNGNVTVNGTTVISMSSTSGSHHVGCNSSGTYYNIVDSGGSTATGSTTVTHNADGKKSITIAATLALYTLDGAGGSGTTPTASATVALTDIPRTSNVTLSVTSTDMGEQITVYTNRVSTAMTHTITYSFGSLSGQTDGLSQSTSVGDSATFTPPLTLANQIPSATSGVCVITCETFANGTSLGSTTANLTLNLPSSVLPVISSFTVAPYNENSIVSGWGIYLQNFTKINVNTTAAGVYGSTISSYKITCTGITDITTASGTSGVLTAAGTNIPVTCVVTDTRGRTASSVQNITVHEYTAPTINSLQCYRCDSSGEVAADGQYIRVSGTATCSSCNGNNVLHAYSYYKESGASSTFSGTFQLGYTSGGATTFGFNTIIKEGTGSSTSRTFDNTKSYIIRFAVRDGSNPAVDNTTLTISNIDKMVSSKAITFSLKNGGTGVCFGAYATHNNAVHIANEWGLILNNAIYGTTDPTSGSLPTNEGQIYLQIVS